jgi:hypothetical protein
MGFYGNFGNGFGLISCDDYSKEVFSYCTYVGGTLHNVLVSKILISILFRYIRI